jgi:predicted nucleic acid-binding Zn ribbon protein
VIPLQDFMPGALAAVMKKAPLTPEKVAFAWRAAVGPAVANVTEATLRQGILHVTARDKTWQREVRRAAPVILARLGAVLGDAVSRLEVTAAMPSGRSAGESGSANRRR